VSNSGTSSDAVFDFTIPQGPEGPPPSLNVTTFSGTSLTLSDIYNNTVVRCTASTAITAIIPTGLTSNFSCMLIQDGTGQITVTASGTTLNSFASLVRTAGRYAPVSIINVGTNTYNISGNLI
jgi:hypothetical protein